MFQEEKKMLAELKVLRGKIDEINKTHEIYIKESKLDRLKRLEDKRSLITQRIKEIESFLYPDVIA